MDLLTSSGSLVTTAAAGKAVGTWAARRPFGGVDNGRFAASMGTVLGRGGRIRRSHHHYCARMGVVSERVLVRSKGGVRKSVHGGDVDRVKWLTTIF